MFAFYAFPAFLLNTLVQGMPDIEYKLIIGSPEQGKEFVIGADVDVTRMFMLPAFSELDLTNVKTNSATNLSRMFEFTILYKWLARGVGMTNRGIDIST